MAAQQEARKHRRFSVELDAAVAVGDRRLNARTRDISRSGICLISPEPVKHGTEISVELVLAFGNNAFSEPLNVKARVVWCTALFGAYQVGAMFANLEGDRARFLDVFLRFLDGTLTPSAVGVSSPGAPEGGTPEPEDEEDEETRRLAKDDPFRP